MPEYERKNLSRSNYEKEEDEITKNLQKLKKIKITKTTTATNKKTQQHRRSSYNI